MSTQEFAMLFVQNWGSFTIDSFDKHEIIGSIECYDQQYFTQLLQQWAITNKIHFNIAHRHWYKNNDGRQCHVMAISYRPSYNSL